MVEMFLLMFGSIVLVCGTIGLITIIVGVIAITKMWNRYRMGEKVREAYYRLKWYISGRGFGS